MKGLVYRGPRQVEIVDVPDPKIEKETDGLVRITTTNICGSDLHMYEGRTSVEKGKVLGHENLGEVIAVGKAVDRIKVGDWVCLPFNVSCGFCKNCEAGLTSACLTTNPGHAGAAYGYAEMGPYQGGQAELLRVPYADFNCLVLPPDAKEKQNDYVMLADIWPTGWHATELAQVQTGESVVIYGSGPVGLFAAYSAIIKGASEVMVVDRHRDRLQLAEKIGAVPIDDSREDPVDRVMQLTGGEGADKGCECVGWQAHDPAGREVPNDTMNKLVKSVRPTGRLGVVGVFVPQDPKPADPLMKNGQVAFDIGLFFHKGLQMGSGQTPVKAYNRKLCRLIAKGKAKPSFLVSHELPLHGAPDAYRHFDAREDGWTKVVLKPVA
ncbi:MAG TPA: glutathione-independent formaldehyde dehydrogenase [Roseiarcus sp.]|jgi:threonine dehydrogenase-like Zn-dependent dehydrogenase|nr:glutathione-independent formaldehyde dehydrogenase [Roseiarcus sp.]